jgi:Reverse transcriptase (RNA-dependent DNA polymerase)
VSGFARDVRRTTPSHVLDNEAQRGRRWVVETDIANCCDAIPKDQLIHAVQERVCDQSVLKLLRVVLGAGVMTAEGQVRRSVTGTPQGGPLSPLLCNAYLHQLDRVWSVGEHGVLVRYCDDLVVMCRSREQAEAALARLSQLLARDCCVDGERVRLIGVGVPRLGRCRRGATADKDDLWITRARSGLHRRRHRADPAEGSVERGARWQADPHRRRVSAEERKRCGSTAVLWCR